MLYYISTKSDLTQKGDAIVNAQPNRTLKAFNRIIRETDALYHTLSVRSGFSDSAFSILYTICELGDGCLQKDVCEMFAVSKQTINSAMRKLEQDGVLTLSNGRGRDRHIHLTEKGQMLVQDKILPVIAAENAVFDNMPEHDREELLRLTAAYLTLLRKQTQSFHPSPEDF